VEVRVHIWPSKHWVDDEAWATVVAVANEAEADIRTHLPTLENDLYLLLHQTDVVIPETGDGGFTIGPHCIRWDVDPDRGVAVARAHLRRTLFHECHHAVRLQRRPEEAEVTDWPTVVVFEGLACAFADESGSARPSHEAYDEAVIEAWAAELLRQPVDDTWPQWKFEHPDGRRNIAYRVGTWIADRAIARSGRSAAELVWAAPAEVMGLAGLTRGSGAEAARG
jgi:hypothetical protein